ncbi:D-glycerate dehydrogenase [Halobacillus locisalis]|uniref:D-glycerate dehydrogenase n=1 Tax=Halobacillus locisalis TaxID=220753 RepID=A0A838CVB5_9BACI|nr:D-glycerate dehydrogenase [Halobacillus locisalis]
MTKPRIYITRRLPEDVVAPYRKDLDIEMWSETDVPVDHTHLQKEAVTADGLVTMLTENVDEELLGKAENLKIVANLAVGYDNIDVQAAKRRDIQVTNTPDVLTDTTADLIFGLVLATARRLTEAERYIKEGKWENWSPLLMAGTDVHHKTMGIVGMGRIGKMIAKRARGFDMNVLYHNRSRDEEAEDQFNASYATFDDLLTKADYVVCMVPLTRETEGMFNKNTFRKMKNTAIFINGSRGQTVIEADLYEALIHEDIAGAGLDVFAEEPISKDHPLLQLDQVVALPHIGSASKETRYKMMDLCLENIDRYFKGKSVKTPVSNR